MKILFVSTFYGKNLGGAEISLEFLNKTLVEKGFDTKILSLFLDSKLFNIIPKKIFIFGNKFLDYFIYLYLNHKIKKIKPDIIHVNDLFILPATIKLKMKINIPIIFTLRDELPREYKIINYNILKNRNILYKTCINKCDMVISISNFIKNNLVEFGVNIKKIRTIYNISNFKNKINNINDFDNSKIINIFSPGRLFKEKGFEFLIKAIYIVKKINNKFILTIMGNGPQKNYLKKLIHKYNLKENICLVKNINNKKIGNFYNQCDFVVFCPIYNEPLGRVAIEAGCYKKPVIASNVGGIPEIIKNDISGILVEPKNIEQLARAILLLIKNRKKRLLLGKNNYEFIKKNFNPDKIVNETINLYNNIIIKNV